jgi:hypothetical protein
MCDPEGLESGKRLLASMKQMMGAFFQIMIEVESIMDIAIIAGRMYPTATIGRIILAASTGTCLPTMRPHDQWANSAASGPIAPGPRKLLTIANMAILISQLVLCYEKTSYRYSL